ncbi:MAG: ARMT1-like domain-containing protein [Pseudonocardiaceae bacterium]
MRVYDLDTGQLVAERPGHRDWVRVVAFASDAPLLASGSGDGTVCLWSVADGRLTLLRSTPTGDRVRALSVSPDAGVIDSAGEDATIRTITAAGIVRETTMPAAVDWVRALAAVDDELALGCENGAVRLLRDGHLSELAMGRDTVWSTALTPDGEFALLGHSDGTVEVNRADWNTPERRLHAGAGRVWALDAAAGFVAAACGDGSVRAWNLDDPTWLMVLNQDGSRAWAVAVHPAGRTLAASSGAGALQLWDLPTGELRWRRDVHAGRVRSVAFDPTGRVLVTGGGDGAARAWDTETGRQLSDVRSPTGWVRAVTVDDTATRLAAGLGSGDISIRHIDIDSQPVPTPYYVSDATTADVAACMRKLARAGGYAAGAAQRLQEAFRVGRVRLRTSWFYTAPLDFTFMPKDLATEFSAATLTILKGDLNYRRVFGDRHWQATTAAAQVGGYFPGRFAVLRTLKSDVVVGIPKPRLDELDAGQPQWRTSGTHAMVQFVA